MKNDMTWTKTILTVYRYLERISGAIDKIILQSGLNSSNIVGSNYFSNNTYSVSQRIIDLSERKVTLINLKVLIETSLSEIGQIEAELLIEKYLNGLKSHELAEKFSLSMRTVFRRLINAEKALKNRLQAKGYTDMRLKYMLKDEGWINNIYNQFASKDNQEIILSKVYLAKAVSM